MMSVQVQSQSQSVTATVSEKTTMRKLMLLLEQAVSSLVVIGICLLLLSPAEAFLPYVHQKINPNGRDILRDISSTSSSGTFIRNRGERSSKTAIHSTNTNTNSNDRIIAIPTDQPIKAYEQQTPHAPCHFRPTHPGTPRNHGGPKKRKRFFEGWYYRITIPEEDISFAFIFSIEDPILSSSSSSSQQERSPLSLCCQQVMGPNDEYLVQSDPDHTKFWAWHGQQGLGCTFQYNHDANKDMTLRTALHPDEEWPDAVKSGFQMLPNRLQGRLIGHDGSLGGVGPEQGIPGQCSYDMTIQPLAGWGDQESGQKSTAGWLARYGGVFEPHWQVTLADARASGSVTWKGKTYNFQDCPFYAEKNWGGQFPLKWYWTQCNSFDGYMDRDNSLAVTAGGGTRKIPFGQTESLGMVSVHYKGTMYEAVPWTGTMEWDIKEWGEWIMKGLCTNGARPFEVEITAICDVPGVKLRAPTEKDGMVYFCRDSFFAKTTLSLWELIWDDDKGDYIRGKTIIDAAKSRQGAVEVGGGPWWDTWKAKSVMKQPMKGMVRLPYRISNLKKTLMRRNKKKNKS